MLWPKCSCEINIETSLIMVVHLYVGDFGIILILFNVYVV